MRIFHIFLQTNWFCYAGLKSHFQKRGSRTLVPPIAIGSEALASLFKLFADTKVSVPNSKLLTVANTPNIIATALIAAVAVAIAEIDIPRIG